MPAIIICAPENKASAVPIRWGQTKTGRTFEAIAETAAALVAVAAGVALLAMGIISPLAGATLILGGAIGGIVTVSSYINFPNKADAKVINLAKKNGHFQCCDSDELPTGLTYLSMNERKKCFDQALRLITENMDGNARNDLVNAVAAILPDEREESVNQSLRLITENMDGSARKDIVNAVADIPAGIKTYSVSQALLQISPHMNDQDRLSILREVYLEIASKNPISQLKLELGEFNNRKSLDAAFIKWFQKNDWDKTPKDPVSQQEAAAEFWRVIELNWRIIELKKIVFSDQEQESQKANITNLQQGLIMSFDLTFSTDLAPVPTFEQEIASNRKSHNQKMIVATVSSIAIVAAGVTLLAMGILTSLGVALLAGGIISGFATAGWHIKFTKAEGALIAKNRTFEVDVNSTTHFVQQSLDMTQAENAVTNTVECDL